MADPPKTRVPPLAIIIAVVLVALVVIAVVQMRGVQKTPSGILEPPQKGNVNAAVMPQTSTVPNAPQPPSPTNGDVAHANDSSEKGGPATTANVVSSPR